MVENGSTAHKFKRLQSATDIATNASNQAELLYKKARSLAPHFLEPSISRVEGYTATLAAAPVVAKAQDAGEQLLLFADDKVDYALNTAEHVMASTKSGVAHGVGSVLAMHQSNMQTYSKTSEKYFEMLTKTADWVAEKLNPVKGVQAAREALASALQTARSAADPDVAVEMAADAWNKFAAYPAVAKLLSTAEPATNLGLHTFTMMHDAVVASSLYKMTVDRTATTLGWATASTPYRLGMQYLYPFVQPVAEPAIDTVGKSKVFSQVVDYWKPVAAA